MRIAVVGSGPGGLNAAMCASRLGAEVVLVEKDHLGGVCLNKGCIPTKALLRSAEVFSLLKKADDFGIVLENPRVDLKKMVERKNKLVERLRFGVESLLKKHNVNIVGGRARLLSPNLLCVDTSNGGPETIETDKIILATGSDDLVPPFVDTEREAVLTTSRALKIEHLPSSLVVVGGGAVGVEFASLFNALGSDVTLIEMLPQILPQEDPELSGAFRERLEARGIKVVVGTKVEGVDYKLKGVSVRLFEGKAVSAEKILVAVGRKPVVAELGFEEVGVFMQDGAIVVDEGMKTSVPNVYAVGDVIGRAMFAHVAMAEGLVAGSNALDGDEKMTYELIPNCVYSFPELASVGLTKEKAGELGFKVKVGRFPLAAGGRAHTLRETEGFIQLLMDTTHDRILGCQIIGYNATELIHEATLAIKLKATVRDLIETMHAHPTLSEGFVEAARSIYGKEIHPT